MYKNYIFDLYGTLVDIHTDEEKTMLWERMSLFYGYYGANYEADELRSEYLESVKREVSKITTSEHPDIEIEVVFNELFTYKGVTVSDDVVINACKVFRLLSTEWIKLYDGVIDLLDTLKSKGKKIYLLSNAQTSFTIPELKMLGLLDYFDDICISSDYKVSKPDSQFYNTLIHKQNLNVNESIMIGNDLNADIKGANLVGLDCLYIKSNILGAADESAMPTYSILDGDVRKIIDLIIK